MHFVLRFESSGKPPPALAAANLGGQRFQLRLPVTAKPLQPKVNLLQTPCLDGVDTTRAFRPHSGEPIFPQDPQMLRHCRLSDAEFGVDDVNNLAR